MDYNTNASEKTSMLAKHTEESCDMRVWDVVYSAVPTIVTLLAHLWADMLSIFITRPSLLCSVLDILIQHTCAQLHLPQFVFTLLLSRSHSSAREEKPIKSHLLPCCAINKIAFFILFDR